MIRGNDRELEMLLTYFLSLIPSFSPPLFFAHYNNDKDHKHDRYTNIMGNEMFSKKKKKKLESTRFLKKTGTCDSKSKLKDTCMFCFRRSSLSLLFIFRPFARRKKYNLVRGQLCINHVQVVPSLHRNKTAIDIIGKV